MWLLSAFKPNVPISIQAWLLLKHTRHTLGSSLSTDVPKCLIGYHWYLQLLASHRLDPCEALNLGSVCSRQLHGNMGPCNSSFRASKAHNTREVLLYRICASSSLASPGLDPKFIGCIDNAFHNVSSYSLQAVWSLSEKTKGTWFVGDDEEQADQGASEETSPKVNPTSHLMCIQLFYQNTMLLLCSIHFYIFNVIQTF